MYFLSLSLNKFPNFSQTESLFFTVISRKMSTATLRINKFEDGSNCKSLFITIPTEDDSANIKFSAWAECAHNSKESVKSSRLVVKIVSGEELKKIDLDACSTEIADTNISPNSSTAPSLVSMPLSISIDASHLGNGNHTIILPDYYQAESEKYTLLNNSEFSNPLEHSLQRVKENNARIMENINILNRTLNYTKKKEILDIICPKSMRTFPCNSCGKCFVYETGLRRHYSMRHALAEMQPRWQVVFTCVQCFQVWPRQDQAVKHSIDCCKSFSDNQECVREIKTSLLLQCEFCEKVFTSIPRLLRHSKIHTTASNYECNSCGLTFTSYKMAEQHWPVCPWLNAYYCFSLPKMLLCNACDRKFRNYEHLYNHRYKVGHFMTKTHCSTGGVNTLGMLVYQCELCTLWYNSIPQMISHRNQHHPFNDPSNFNKVEAGYENSESFLIPSENEYYFN